MELPKYGKAAVLCLTDYPLCLVAKGWLSLSQQNQVIRRTLLYSTYCLLGTCCLLDKIHLDPR